jgi:hypothetical protein
LRRSANDFLPEDFMKYGLTIAMTAALVTAACARGTQVQAAGDVAPMTPSSSDYLPAGTTMTARLDQSLGTASSHEGDGFTLSVIAPVIAQDGSVAVPAGSTISGHVTGLHSATIPGQQSVIRLNFDDVRINGRTYPFTGSVENVTVENQSTNPTASSTTRSAVTGAAAGAVLGAIIGGLDLSKILEGGLLGAAAGTVISLGTGSTESVIPAGSTMTVRATQPVQLR